MQTSCFFRFYRERSVSAFSTVLHWACILSQTLPLFRNPVTSRWTLVVLVTSLWGYTLFSASRTAENDFDAKYCSSRNTRSTGVCIMSHLHSFCAGDVSSGLATRMTLTWVSRGSLGEAVTGGGWAYFWFNSYAVVCVCYWVVFFETLNTSSVHWWWPLKDRNASV
jgi:hypothetical protein